MPKEKKPRQESSGISRRDFFRSGATGAVSTALLSTGATKGQGSEDTAILGPGEVEIKLSLNGKIRKLSVEPRRTLLDALRDELDITGAKKVCDRGTCGACTVLMDGKPVYACSILAVEAEGKQIVTVEGLGSEDQLHPLQKAFANHDAQQCGFCTPGFVVASKAFLDRHPNPSTKEIKQGLGGNLCRCGTYVGVREAILETAAKGGSDA
jgi:xanthine dehydrogenase YagT iron-sulfur-binding subunit